MKTVEQQKLEDAIYAVQVAITHEGQGAQRDRWEALLPEMQEHHRQMAVENARLAKQQQQFRTNNPAPIPLHPPAPADPAHANLGADTKTGEVIPRQPAAQHVPAAETHLG